MNASPALLCSVGLLALQLTESAGAVTCARADYALLRTPLCLVRIADYQPFPSAYGPKTEEETYLAGTATVDRLICNQQAPGRTRTYEVGGPWQTPVAIGEQYLLWTDGDAIGTCNSVEVPLDQTAVAEHFLALLGSATDDPALRSEQLRLATELGLPGFPAMPSPD